VTNPRRKPLTDGVTVSSVAIEFDRGARRGFRSVVPLNALDRRTPEFAPGSAHFIESKSRTMPTHVLTVAIVASLLVCAIGGASLVRSARDYPGHAAIMDVH